MEAYELKNAVNEIKSQLRVMNIDPDRVYTNFQLVTFAMELLKLNEMKKMNIHLEYILDKTRKSKNPGCFGL